jgi:hypothetical protein
MAQNKTIESNVDDTELITAMERAFALVVVILAREMREKKSL